MAIRASFIDMHAVFRELTDENVLSFKQMKPLLN